MTLSEIRTALETAFTPTDLIIQDDSDLHRGHYTDQADLSHLAIKIVSTHFEGQSPVTRQRAVYAALAPAFQAGLHAVQLKTLTPEENSD